MSHSVTITRTTTSTTNTSYIVLNTGYMKSAPGMLKLLQLIIGAVCVGIFAYYYNMYGGILNSSIYLFFFLMVTTFMIGTFCLLLACLTSLSTGGIIAKTIYELIYHCIAGILLLVASILILIDLTDSRYKNYRQHDMYMAAAVMGLANSILYFISTYLAHKSYRGI
ncbi:uncharacterized protein LOC129947260 [Eupeodes corollae]|uniref:uncharacterized protein LOC129947260 n=1 Tax=Eupeodes corollae TaxID=290404 RepID=UPI0024905223|nr:uncharacterized protein LOC129947260 [Eupeodes corollae]